MASKLYKHSSIFTIIMSRIAIIKKELCNPIGCGNFLCKRYCPINRKGEDCIYTGEDGKAKIDEIQCIGCMICPKKCPFEAIEVINLPEQLKDEIKTVIDFVIYAMGVFGFKDYEVEISTRPEKSIGSDEEWERATSALQESLKEKDIN